LWCIAHFGDGDDVRYEGLGDERRFHGDVDLTDLVEREREFDELLAALTAARAGTGRLVLISGEAGVGKSKLLDAAADLARASGLGVLAARGLEFERDFPFGVALQLLEPPLDAARPSRRAELLASAAASAALFDGNFDGNEVSGLADGVDRSYAFVHGLRRLTANLVAARGGDARPVLIAVDDAQWADSLSLRFLIRLAVDLNTLPVAMVIAARDGDAGQNATLLRKLASGARELRPGRLSPLGVATVVAAAYPQAAPEFCQACASACGGNPFYLHEIIKAAQADGIPATARAAAEIAGLMPESVLHSVLLRVAQVPGAGPALAAAAAILGDAAPLALAAELASLDEETAEQAADSLARVRILVPGEPLSFTHPLIGAAIRDDLPALARSRAHRRAAGLLAAQGARAELVAAHLLACRPADDAGAADILRQAADQAAARGEYDATRRFLERALAERPASGPQTDLCLQLALAQAAVGVPDAPATLASALELIHDRQRRAQALHALARLQFARSDFPAAAAAIDRALSQLDQADPLARDLRIDQMAIGALDPDLCPEAVTRLAALTDDARNGRPPREAALLAQVANAMVVSGEPAARVREVARAAVQGIGGDRFYGIITGSVVFALIHIDELDLATPPVEATMERARRAGSLIGTGFASHWRAMLHYHRGALDQAIAAGEDTLDACRAGWDLCLPWVVSLLVRAHLERGDLGAATEALHLCESMPGRAMESALLLEARGHLALARGHPAEALASLQEAGALTATAPPTMLPWRSAAALAAARLGQRDRAAELAAAELDQARHIGARRTLGCALRAAGLIAEGPQGLELLTEAVAVLEHSPAALERARALTDLGAAYRRVGRLSAARQILHRASQAAQDLGAAPLASRAREELHAAGGRRRSHRHHVGPAALTPTERRVAQLAANGLSTPEIARTLCVSPKTIEWHLDHVYRKLAIRSRHQLPTALNQRPS
jgi:DNA-binding CsgD family transcriptional regulator